MNKLTEEQKSLVKKYEHLFNNTGGNDIVELIEREDVNAFNNLIVYVLQVSCMSQLEMLQRLKKEFLLFDIAKAHKV